MTGSKRTESQKVGRVAAPRWNSAGERECRERLEALKVKYYRSAKRVEHPCLSIQEENLDVARANIQKHDWARQHYEGMLALAGHYTDRSAAWSDTMVPDLTPLHVYGTFCPVCEADNTYRMKWDYRDPEKLVCFHCGAAMTDQRFVESGRLRLPRSGQVLPYYVRPGEVDDRRFSTGRNAFMWAGRKVHSSYQGAIRQNKAHHMTGVARTLAVVYRMTGEDRYARTAAAVLKRFAEVYPTYLFHDYWNTYMDCDPLYACELMARDENIGKYEVNACPDQDARSAMASGKLIQTFWGCGRLSSGGVQAEARHLVNLAEALDLIWDATDREGHLFLTEGERKTVVRNLIVEGLFAFTHWEGINNKVAGCRVGEVALGRFLGAPAYVHRGVEGFKPYVRGFFKFDGSTAEGSGYYAYGTSNVHDLPEVARGYSDPLSYRRKDRFDDLDLYDPDGPYRTVLRARAYMTLPDGRVPHTADAQEGGPGWPGPTWLHNIGLVRLGKEFAPFVRLDSGDDFALFNRPADLEPIDPPPVRDLFFPGWLLAIFNTGYEHMFQEDLAGTATFLMNFYEPEGHDHPDALNIAMFAEGVEVLSDLGYIGDHPLNASIKSTLKHNLVVVDEKEQLPRGRRPPGSVRLIAASPRVKFIEADCKAYDEADVYRRSCFMVHRGKGPAYLVDGFRVKGGRVHDYAIHGEGKITSRPVAANSRPISLKSRKGVIGRDIENLRAGAPRGPWSTAWTDEGMTMRVRFLSPTEEVILGDGPGQRDHAEIGLRKDYLFARNREQGSGNGFVTLIDHYRKTPDITGVRSILPPGGADGPTALQITRRGGTDIVLQTPDGSDLTAERFALTGRAAVYTQERGGRSALFLAEAARFASPDFSVVLKRPVIEGEIASYDSTGFQAAVAIPDGAALGSSFVEVEDPDQGCWTAYAVKSVRGRCIAVNYFPFNGGSRFRIPSVFWMEEDTKHCFRIRTTTSAEIKIRTSLKKAVLEREGKQVGILEVESEDGWLRFRINPRVLRSKEAILKLK